MASVFSPSLAEVVGGPHQSLDRTGGAKHDSPDTRRVNGLSSRNKVFGEPKLRAAEFRDHTRVASIASRNRFGTIA